jgi:hypothetical protein
MTAPNVGWVRVFTNDPPLSVVARLAEDRPNVEAGYGGWDEVVRPRRSPITTWRASPGLRLTLPILLDGWEDDVSVEPQISRIQQMGRPVASDGDPPRVRIEATGSAIPYTGRVWVVTELAWGDALMNARGNRVRQQVTLSLLEYVRDVYLAERSAANRRKKKKATAKKRSGAKSKRIVAKRSAKPKPKAKAQAVLGSTVDEYGSGEDLLTIAARELGDADRWVEIAELNDIRDPRTVLPGQVLRLP